MAQADHCGSNAIAFRAGMRRKLQVASGARQGRQGIAPVQAIARRCCIGYLLLGRGPVLAKA
jgi:hypothetical protein